MTTYRNVKAQIEKLEKQAADLLKKEIAGVITQIRTLMAEYGLTTADLGLSGKAAKTSGKLRQKKASPKSAGQPKYRDPVSGKTWTGRGRAPAWFADAAKQGKQDDLLIAKVSAPSVDKKPAKKTIAKPVTKSVVQKPTAKKTAPSTKRPGKVPSAPKAAVKKKAAAPKAATKEAAPAISAQAATPAASPTNA